MNETEVYIHIGYHKTGSTFLQRSIIPHLPVNAIIMPDVKYIAESEDYRPARFVEQLTRGQNLDIHDKTVISQETLTGRGDGNPIWDPFLISSRLHETFPKGKIIVVIRNQFDYILSLYTYRVIARGMERRSFSRYLADKQEWLCRKLQFDRLIANYLELFGSDNVLVLPYEQLVVYPSSFLRAILEFVGIGQLTEFDIDRVNKGNRNRRILSLNRAINYPFGLVLDFLKGREVISGDSSARLSNDYFSFKRRVINPWIFWMFSSDDYPLVWDVAWKARYGQIFQGSNHQLAAITGLDLAAFGYPC